MNPIDTSVCSIDEALDRRFTRIDYGGYQSEIIYEMCKRKLDKCNDKLKITLDEINNALSSRMQSCVAACHFADIKSRVDWVSVWKRVVLPKAKQVQKTVATLKELVPKTLEDATLPASKKQKKT